MNKFSKVLRLAREIPFRKNKKINFVKNVKLLYKLFLIKVAKTLISGTKTNIDQETQ